MSQQLLVYPKVGGESDDGSDCDLSSDTSSEGPPEHAQMHMVKAAEGNLDANNLVWMKYLYWRKHGMMAAICLFPFYLGLRFYTWIWCDWQRHFAMAIFPEWLMQFSAGFFPALYCVQIVILALETLAFVLLIAAAVKWASYRTSRKFVVVAWTLCYGTIFLMLLAVPLLVLYDFAGLKTWICSQALEQTLFSSFAAAQDPPVAELVGSFASNRTGYIKQALAEGHITELRAEEKSLALAALATLSQGNASVLPFCEKYAPDGSYSWLIKTGMREFMGSAFYCLRVANQTADELTDTLMKLADWRLMFKLPERNALVDQYNRQVQKIHTHLPFKRSHGLNPCMFTGKKEEGADFSTYAQQVRVAVTDLKLKLQKATEMSLNKTDAGIALADVSIVTFDTVEVLWLALQILTERAIQLASMAWIIAHGAIGSWMSVVSLTVAVPVGLAAIHGIHKGVLRVKVMLPMQPWLGLFMLFIGAGSLPAVFSLLVGLSQGMGSPWISGSLLFVVGFMITKGMTGWEASQARRLKEWRSVENEFHLIECCLVGCIMASVIGGLGMHPTHMIHRGTASTIALAIMVPTAVIMCFSRTIVVRWKWCFRLTTLQWKIITAVVVVLAAGAIALLCTPAIKRAELPMPTVKIAVPPLAIALEVYCQILHFVVIMELAVVSSTDLVLGLVTEALHIDAALPMDEKLREAYIVDAYVRASEDKDSNGNHRKLLVRGQEDFQIRKRSAGA